MAKKNKLKKQNQLKSSSSSSSWRVSPELLYLLSLLGLPLAIWLFITFFSYLFTWQEDFNKIGVVDRIYMLSNKGGHWGATLAKWLIYDSLGATAFVLPILLFTYSWSVVTKKPFFCPHKLQALLFFLPWFSIFSGAVFPMSTSSWWGVLPGRWGYGLAELMRIYTGTSGLILLLLASLCGIGIVFFPYFFNRLWKQLLGWLSSLRFSSPTSEDAAAEFTPPSAAINDLSLEDEALPEDSLESEDDGFRVVMPEEEQIALPDQRPKDYDPTLDLSSFLLPHVDLLTAYNTENQVTKEELSANKQRIIQTLAHYNIPIREISATVGPTITLYEIIPSPGIRIAKIKSLEDDIALNLAALGIRIIAPMPGKGTVGIEVPNEKPQMVPMRNMLSSDKFVHAQAELPLVLGKTIANETFVVDLAKMPHLLIAGATGQGKSVGINAIIMSLLYKKHPSQMKFVFVDPKKVELSLYSKIERHYLAKLPEEEDAIVTDTSKVVKTLNSLCKEMDERYELLKEAQCKNLREYNAKYVKRVLNPEMGHRFLPYIVLVIDEFADLIMTAGKEVEMPIARLAQLARAIGIHLIVATQRPSVNVITGVIKANFPARIAFRVMSQVDSKTILDTTGAERLIGRGDMLYTSGNEPVRLQCGFVDTPEVEDVVDYIAHQTGYATAYYLPDMGEEEGEDGAGISPDDRDDRFEQAARLVVATQQGSTSLIQRKLKLGYNRAGRIMDQLEAAGVVGPFEGSKSRRVLILDEQQLEKILNHTKN